MDETDLVPRAAVLPMRLAALLLLLMRHAACGMDETDPCRAGAARCAVLPMRLAALLLLLMRHASLLESRGLLLEWLHAQHACAALTRQHAWARLRLALRRISSLCQSATQHVE